MRHHLALPSEHPATCRDRTAIRLVHRISTRKINALSPENFRPSPLFPCATHVPLRPFIYRAGSQDTGRAQRLPGCCGREGRMQIRIGTPGANGRALGHEVLDLMARWGQGRSGCGWVFGSAVATGVRKDLWMRKTRQRVNPSGRRQGGRKTRARTASEHLAPFLIPPWPKETGPANRWGPRSRQGYFSASVAPVPDP